VAALNRGWAGGTAKLTGPVRPPRRVLEAMVRALALPGVGGVRMDRAVKGRPLTTPVAPVLEALAREVRPRLRASEREAAEGWARAALATIDRAGLHVLTPDMAAYPARFRELAAPPFAAFCAGRLELLRNPIVAIVGTRSCTARGLDAAGRIARGLAAAEVTVVSGLALGIDGAAHQAAGPGCTIAVLGCGLDVAYPPRHRSLQREIARQGLLLSEQLPGAPPLAFHFPRRNRMIAALAQAVVVVEAPEKSGALITVDHALELGRTVLAVPGPHGARANAGTNRLIDEGASVVTSAREVLDVLGLPVVAADAEPEPPPGLHGIGLALWRSLSPTPRHVDELAGEIGLEPHYGLASLLALEIQGHARQLPGLRFARR
jgi:DNA processing protein